MGLGAGLGDVDVVDVVDVAHGCLQKVDFALHPFRPQILPFRDPHKPALFALLDLPAT